MVTYAYNPSCRGRDGGRGQKDCVLRPSGQKNSQDPISTNKNLGVVVHACHPSYSRKPKIRSWSRPAQA
jgi:hypothetical protein